MTNAIQVDRDEPEKRALDRRMQEVAWACALLMTGALWLAPESWAPEGTWLAGFGIILLTLNAARHLCKLKTDAFGTVVGAAIVAGAVHALGGKLPFVPLLSLGLGTAMLVKVIAGIQRHGASPGGARCC